MGKNKGKFKNQPDEEQEFGKKKKNIITPELLMDKSNMDFTEFIPLLPEDVLYPPFKISPDSTKALLKIVTDLNYLLYLQPKNFWATVTYNISFQHCLSSCLSQLSVRWMNKYIFLSQQQNDPNDDLNYRIVRDLDAYSYFQALHQVLLKLVFRIMCFQQQDPKLNEIYNFGQNTIKKLNVFNYVKLLQLIEIYGQKEQNFGILKQISRNFLKIIPYPYKYFVDELLPHIIKKIEANNRDMKLVTDRQEFGVTYSYKRLNPKALSPGQEELRRKITILMNYLSVLKLIKNTKIISEEILDHLYFNPQINFIFENVFYELDAAYKIWNFQTMENRLLPLFNEIILGTKDYFVEYFNRVNEKVIKRQSKMNVEAYVKSLERFFKDYGKRYSLGKKGATIKHMTLFKLILKQVNLIDMLQQLYMDEQENKTFQFNMEYFVDFKLALQDCAKEDNYINQNDPRQAQIQAETQVPQDVNVDDIEQNPNLNNQQVEEKQEEESDQLVYHKPENEEKLEFLVSKKSRDDDYYEQLYLKQKQRFKIQYEDEYDDLVDYDKRPLFMDSASSDSQGQEQLRMQRLVSNENNQKANQIKHIKFEEKQKEKKNQPKYSKVTQKQKQQISSKYQRKGQSTEQQKGDAKAKYVAKEKERPQYIAKQKDTQEYEQRQKPAEKGNTLQQLLQDQKIPQQGGQGYDDDNSGNNGRGGRDGQGGYKKRYVPHKNYDNKNANEKGRNSNKNRQHGNPQNQGFGGGKKYKAKY